VTENVLRIASFGIETGIAKLLGVRCNELRILITGGRRVCINQPSTLSTATSAEIEPRGGVFGARWTDFVRIVVRVQAA
jgi:hypothetical protein